MKGKSNKSKIIKKIAVHILKYFFILIVILFVLYSLIFNFNKLFFSNEYIKFGSIEILTETDDLSMRPEIRESDLLIVINSNNIQLEKDNIIAYENSGKLFIQRICNIENDNGKTFYITKGDNNLNNNIEKITNNQIIGKLYFKIPILGFIAKIFQNQYVCLFIIIWALGRLEHLFSSKFLEKRTLLNL